MELTPPSLPLLARLGERACHRRGLHLQLQGGLLAQCLPLLLLLLSTHTLLQLQPEHAQALCCAGMPRLRLDMFLPGSLCRVLWAALP